MMNKIIEEIAAERNRQIGHEGWTPEHDDEHTDESLATAAACYAAPERIFVMRDGNHDVVFRDPWPWTGFFRGDDIRGHTSWKKDGKSRRHQLVIAAALIVAEIERLDRKQP